MEGGKGSGCRRPRRVGVHSLRSNYSPDFPIKLAFGPLQIMPLSKSRQERSLSYTLPLTESAGKCSLFHSEEADGLLGVGGGQGGGGKIRGMRKLGGRWVFITFTVGVVSQSHT